MTEPGLPPSTNHICLRLWGIQLLVHQHPPLGAPDAERKDGRNTREKGDQRNHSAHPSIADAIEHGLSDDGASACKDISHKICHGNTARCFLGSELRQSGLHSAHDKHQAEPEADRGNTRDRPLHTLFSGPAVPNQRGWIQCQSQPDILSHPVLGKVLELAVIVVAIGLGCLTNHDMVDPATTKN